MVLKIFLKIFEILKVLLFEVLDIKSSTNNLTIYKGKPDNKFIIFLLENDSSRAYEIGKLLFLNGWKIISISNTNNSIKEFSYLNFKIITKENVRMLCKKYYGIPIHLFTPAASPLALQIIRYFPYSVIYDPIDIIVGNINNLNFSDFASRRLKLKFETFIVCIYQKLILKRMKNIIFRDLQISKNNAISPAKRRNLNSIFFSDYISSQQKQTKKKPTKLKLVSCGNLNIYDYGNGKATFDVFEKFLQKGYEVHMYPKLIRTKVKESIFLTHPELKIINEKYHNFFLHDTMKNEKLIKQISYFDIGIAVFGEHYFNKYNYSKGFWKTSLYSKNGAARISTLISANLPVLYAKTDKKSYSCFLLERYGKLISMSSEVDIDKVISNLNFENINNLNKNSKFFLINNIPRLEQFYKKISLKLSKNVNSNKKYIR